MNYVIIGNSAAGIGAVEGIRQIDRNGQIIIITEEPYHTYSRPLISYLLLGKVTEEMIKYRDDSFYSDNNCKLIYGTVTEINNKTKTVLVNGINIPYDKLLVGTGSTAFIPELKGLDTVPKKFTFMSLDDMHSLNNALDKDKNVLIIGAGLIGLKCAEGISNRVAHITVMDIASQILPSILNKDSAKLVQNHLESNGIEFKLSENIEYFDNDTAVLKSGERLEFDILVLASGVRPNTALLKDIAKSDRGIIINEKSETSEPDIYAAGDCTQSLDISSGQNKIMALLPNAYIQGECAGINMAGGEKVFNKTIPMNAIGFFGLHIITAGTYTGEVYAENNKQLFYCDNYLNGYIIIGNVEKAGIYTSLIRERIPLDSIDFKLICQKPGLMAFTKKDRAVKLGGEFK